jgi:hypothetical protein
MSFSEVLQDIEFSPDRSRWWPTHPNQFRFVPAEQERDYNTPGKWYSKQVHPSPPLSEAGVLEQLRDLKLQKTPVEGSRAAIAEALEQ